MPYYQAFMLLNGSRQIGVSGALGIPLSEVEAYCRLAEIPTTERFAFVRVVVQFDEAFLGLLDKRKSRTITQPKGQSDG